MAVRLFWPGCRHSRHAQRRCPTAIPWLVGCCRDGGCQRDAVVDLTITSEIRETNNGTAEASVAPQLRRRSRRRATGVSWSSARPESPPDASGIFRLQDVALTPGTTARLDWETATGHRRMPRKGRRMTWPPTPLN